MERTMERTLEVEIAFGDKKVKLTGPESFISSELGRLTAIARGGSLTPVGGGGGPVTEEAADDLGLCGMSDERQFIGLKRPTGHQEIVTVLGFWLQARGAAEFTEHDVRRAYIRAGVRPPKVVSQALRDARRDRDFIEAGSKRGSYKLTAHGDRFVRFDLPRAEKGNTNVGT